MFHLKLTENKPFERKGGREIEEFTVLRWAFNCTRAGWEERGQVFL